MSDETQAPEDDAEEAEGEGYDPNPQLVHEDSFLILDPIEFADHFNCWGCQLRNGDLFVLDRETYQWRNVEDFGKPQPAPRRLKGVQ